MESLYLINRNFIGWDKLLKDGEKIATELDVLFPVEKHKEYIILQFLDKVEHFCFEAFFYDEDAFTKTVQDESFKTGYGKIGRMDFDFDDPHLFRFLKLLFAKYPDMLIYYEEGPALENPFIYSKADLDRNDSMLMLTKPPGN